MKYVQSNRGARFHELRRDLGLGHGTLVHHLRLLEARGLLVLRHDGRRLHVFLPGQRLEPPLPADVAPLVRLLRDEPGLSVGQAAQRLGWTRRRVSYWSGRLQGSGVVEARAVSRWRHLRVVSPP